MKKLFSLSVIIIFALIGCQNEVNLVSSPDNATAYSLSKNGTQKNDNKKVTMRHNGHLISISRNAMDEHFRHGDQLIVTSADLAADFAAVAASPDKWFFYNDETEVIDNSLGSFVEGPGSPFYGNGSAQISVSGTQRRNLATYQFGGTPLADITAMAFSTFNPSVGNGGPANRTGYLNFNVDFDGSDTWQRRLIFTPPSGTVVQDTWQEWDCIDGGNALWHWSGFAGNGNKWPDGNTNAIRTWNDLLTSFPGIRVRVSDPWLGMRVGSPYNSGYTENIDFFKFGTTYTKTFDFEN